jgi:DNA-binding NarL/FixJ family response regulator
MSDSIRVLIADDHLIVREGLRLILETADGIELVGEATEGTQAVRLAKELQPDVVLMDLRMPNCARLPAQRHRPRHTAQHDSRRRTRRDAAQAGNRRATACLAERQTSKRFGLDRPRASSVGCGGTR